MTGPSAPPAALTARRLLRSLDRASLATSLAASVGGGPYASLVLVATAPDGSPLLLVSDLAQHAINIAAEPRVALLFDGTTGLAEPLTGPRVTVLGRAERSADERLRARFLARHPGAALYAGFADFHLYRIAVERAHLVAGFGRIDWIAAAELLPPGLAALADSEEDILRHMNKDDAGAVELYARALVGRQGEGWRLTGIDAEGVDLRREGEVARLDFAAAVGDAQAARAALARLAQEARIR
jgi:putative heme iron utilization protein